MGIINWFKRKTFEGNIQRHIGDITSANQSLQSSKLSIDVLEPTETPCSGRVRIGITMSSFGSYESFGIVLTDEKAKELSALLLAATSTE